MTYSKSVARMTWRGEQPAAFFAGLREFPSNWKKNKVDALSTLSSVCYSYVSYLGRKELPEAGVLRKVWILAKAAFCTLAGMVASDAMVVVAGGLENLSVNKLDVRQSVMRRVRRWEAARKAIFVALGKHPQKPHTTALLFIGMADIFRHARNTSEEKNAWKMAEELISEIEQEAQTADDYRQLARICRHLEEYHLSRDQEYDAAPMRGKKEWATRKAEELETTEAATP